MPLTAADVEALATELATAHPANIIARAQREYGEALRISFSGAEDVVLIDVASRNNLPFRVFTLDTARLHPQTYRFLDTVRERYHVNIEAYYPQPEAVQQLVVAKGYFSFYIEGHEECCAIRKIEPLRRALADASAYVTGQRKDQSPGTRADIPVVQIDTAFSTPERQLVKFNPLANWSSDKVWQYIREHDVPYNPLHDIGFRSIGCEPCTRATNPGEHEREGRWWWEEATKRECGLHIINLGNDSH